MPCSSCSLFRLYRIPKINVPQSWSKSMALPSWKPMCMKLSEISPDILNMILYLCPARQQAESGGVWPTALAEAPQYKRLMPSSTSLLSGNWPSLSQPTSQPPVAQVLKGAVLECAGLPSLWYQEHQGTGRLPGGPHLPSPPPSMEGKYWRWAWTL